MKKTVLLSCLVALGLSSQAQSTLLLDNGPFITDPRAGSNGADVSAIQPSLTIYGFNHNQAAGNRLADDFTVPAGQIWTIDSLVFYAYQTGSPTTSSITGVNVRIWDGLPGANGSNVIFGDTTTNVLANSVFSGVYRTTGTDFSNADRAIMRNAVTTTALALPAGTYWADWQTAGSASYSGPWAPPIAIPGQTVTGDARARSASGAWAALVDGNNEQGLPFLIKGTSTVVSGLAAVNNTVAVSVYPNPMLNEAIINFDKTALENSHVNLTLTDNLGRAVRNFFNLTTNQVIVNRDNLAAGIYLYTLQGERGVLAKGKLIVQ